MWAATMSRPKLCNASVTIPYIRFVMPRYNIRQLSDSILTTSPRGTSMPKILIVEDNEDNRDMLVRRLERRGFQLLVAVDGQQGIELAHSDTPDLILMDMSLPVL